MTDSPSSSSPIDALQKRVQALRAATYSQQSDPTTDSDLLRSLLEAERELAERRAARASQEESKSEESKSEESKSEEPTEEASRAGNMLGAATTGLEATVQLRMDPLPTGAYHLMDPETDPLLTVEIKNVDRETRRVRVEAFIEGLSARAVRTVEVEASKSSSINLQPTLFPDRVVLYTEIQRATLHVIVDDLDGKRECHNTYPLTCLSRNASFNSVRRPDSGELVDLSHYYGAWVTPHAESVQERIREAVSSMPEKRMLGYQGDPDSVPKQIQALYQALSQAEIVYVNSVIDYGSGEELTTQRTRLPRESLASRSANCIDGTVLMASLIEGVSLNPAIVLVPGHALVGWESWQDSGEWQFVETTMIGTADFAKANESGNRQYQQYAEFNQDQIKLHSVSSLRNQGIWPME